MKLDIPRLRAEAGLPGVTNARRTRKVPPAVKRSKSPLIRWLRSFGPVSHQKGTRT